MKNTLLVIAVLLAVSCGKGKEAQTEVTDDNNTKPIKVDDNATKPVKELTLEEKVVGEYEIKEDGNTERGVLLENGIAEAYESGKKTELEGKWKIVDGEMHTTYPNGDIVVSRINKDGSITQIAGIPKDGKRKEVPKEHQRTWEKIK